MTFSLINVFNNSDYSYYGDGVYGDDSDDNNDNDDNDDSDDSEGDKTRDLYITFFYLYSKQVHMIECLFTYNTLMMM